MQSGLVPDIAYVGQQIPAHEGVQPLAGKPVDNIGRFAGQPVANGGFVAFAVVGVEFNFDFRMLLFELVHQVNPSLFGHRVGLTGVDNEVSGKNAAAVQKADEEQNGNEGVFHGDGLDWFGLFSEWQWGGRVIPWHL